MNTAAAFADFRTYPLISALSGVQVLADRVLVTWADARVSPFHHQWLGCYVDRDELLSRILVLQR